MAKTQADFDAEFALLGAAVDGVVASQKDALDKLGIDEQEITDLKVQIANLPVTPDFSEAVSAVDALLQKLTPSAPVEPAPAENTLVQTANP